MRCPHCANGIHPIFVDRRLESKIKNRKEECIVYYEVCPECGEYMIYADFVSISGGYLIRDPNTDEGLIMIYPRNKKPRQLSKDDIPEDYIRDYEEAYGVLTDSPKASAALSRRLLEKLLDDKGFNQKYLADKIAAVIKSNDLPPYLANSIDVVRNIGLFAAHPLKSTATNQIQDVEPGEAEWNLHVLERLLDFYFVQPKDEKRRLDALNKKLEESGKLPVKTSDPKPNNPP